MAGLLNQLAPAASRSERLKVANSSQNCGLTTEPVLIYLCEVQKKGSFEPGW
jgi:hypothetical protein